MFPKNDVAMELRKAMDAIPVIDCHEHTMGKAYAQPWKEPIQSLIAGYFDADLISAGAEKHIPFLQDPDIATDDKWEVFEKFWRRTEHTCYAKVPKWILKNYYNENDMTLKAMHSIKDRLIDPSDNAWYTNALSQANIKARIVNIWPDIKAYIKGKFTLDETDFMMIPLPDFHAITNYESIQTIANIVDHRVACIEDYLEICFTIFSLMKERGTIGMKDQSAYTRIIHFESTHRADAEKLFNFILEDPRRSLGYPERKPLEDYLFHEFMIMARKLEFPVQFHTGHMAGVRNDITKTNAIHLTNTLERHRDVMFDLFHGNWPYMGEYLYLAKNHPNAYLDLCWVTFIDPYYSKNLLCDALTVVPHGKIHLFGGDTGDSIEYAIAHLEITKDVLTAALYELMERQWIDRQEALQIGADLLYNNPNSFFNLKLPEHTL